MKIATKAQNSQKGSRANFCDFAAITGAPQHLTRVKIRFLAEMFAGIMAILLEKRELLVILW